MKNFAGTVFFWTFANYHATINQSIIFLIYQAVMPYLNAFLSAYDIPRRYLRDRKKSEFLQKNRSEAKKVSIYEYDAERHIRMEREEAMEEGMQKVLMRQVRKKLQKGCTLSEIADALETEEAVIQQVMKEMGKVPV